MSQRNFGQHRGGDEGWNKVPDWDSPQQPHQQSPSQRGGFGSSNFGSETTSSLEEEQRFASRSGFEPQGQRGNGFDGEQPQPPYPNEFSQQGFSQNQNESWGSQGFEPNNYNQNPQGYPQNQFDSNHYDNYGHVDNTASSHSPKKKWSIFSVIVTVIIVVVLIFGTMIFISSRAKKSANGTNTPSVAKVETTQGGSKSNETEGSKVKDSDRIFPEGSDSAKEQPKKDVKSEDKPKESSSSSSDLGGSEVKSQPTTKNIDGAKVSSELLVAKGVVKEIHLESSSDLAATYKVVLSVGSTSITVSMNYADATQYKVGDTVTVKYRKLVDLDKVVVESVTK